MNPAKPIRRVLQLGTYPIRKPVHGGQRRVAALRAAYRAAGLSCESLAIYNWVNYPSDATESLDIKIGQATLRRIVQSGWQEDVFVGECLLHDPQCRTAFLKTWTQLAPDLVTLEHPYAWASLRALLKEGAMARPLILYSSHNVEYDLKRDVFPQVLPPHECPAALARVQELEEDLVRSADVVIAVSRADADRFNAMGARQMILVPNGGDRRTVSPAAADRWVKRLAEQGKSRHAVFVGSAHPPNCQGFVQMMGPALGYLPPDCAVVVAGRVAEMIERSELCSGVFGVLNRSRLVLAGPLSDDDLGGVMASARAVLLPITSGGGSNLKTVEALLSGRPIVGTGYAFRSYEDCAGLGHIQMADEPVAFQRCVARALLSPAETTEPTPEVHRRLDEITWERIGQVYVRELLARLGAGAAVGIGP